MSNPQDPPAAPALLKKDPINKSAARGQMVAALEQALAEAKAGRVMSVAIHVQIRQGEKVIAMNGLFGELLPSLFLDWAGSLVSTVGKNMAGASYRDVTGDGPKPGARADA